ncbi:MAG: TraB/GumN family protein [Allosphingosinicella sp.]
MAELGLRARLTGAFLAIAASFAWSAPAAANAPAAASEPAEASVPPRPAIWLLADEDTRIFLFGTVHILPPGLVWRSADLERVIAEADELVMEVGEDPAAIDREALFLPMMMDKSVSILERVSPERREPLRRMIETSGLPMEAYDRMHIWAAALMLAGAAIREAYLDPSAPAQTLSGVEDSLRTDFERTQRPISGVESAEQQLGFFSALPLGSQRRFLESMIDSYLEGDVGFEPEEAGWLGGDVETLGEEMAQLPPDLFEALITRRNAAWTDWLVTRLESPGEVLFAVGAGHLAGRDSLQTMLAARGFTVRRLH